jgi:NADPH2:quinone reductase
VRRLAESGARPVIDEVFPFDQVIPAFERLAQAPMGKVVVRIAG